MKSRVQMHCDIDRRPILSQSHSAGRRGGGRSRLYNDRKSNRIGWRDLRQGLPRHSTTAASAVSVPCTQRLNINASL